MLQTYVRVSLFLAGVPGALHRRVESKRREDTGLATLEWVALAIVAVGLAVTAGIAVQKILERKIAEIP